MIMGWVPIVPRCRLLVIRSPVRAISDRTKTPQQVIYSHWFIFLFGRYFFSSRPQYAIQRNVIIGQIASFERRFWDAAQTPLTLPYPFRTWPGSGTWAERDKREVSAQNFCILGDMRPSFSWILANKCGAWTKNILTGKHVFSNLFASFPYALLFRPPLPFFHGHTSSIWPFVVRLLCRRFSISDFKVKYLCSSIRCLRGGAFITRRHHCTQCPCWFFILER